MDSIEALKCAALLHTIADESGELSDIKAAVNKYIEAKKLGACSVSFRLGFGKILLSLVQLEFSLEFIEEAIANFESIAAEHFARKEDSLAISYFWIAKARMCLALHTFQEEHFKKADTAFHEAILKIPQRVELWLLWTELFSLWLGDKGPCKN